MKLWAEKVAGKPQWSGALKTNYQNGLEKDDEPFLCAANGLRQRTPNHILLELKRESTTSHSIS